jgi:hypothetical protein
MARIADGRWLPSLPRQNQQYWFRGLRLQAQRLRNVRFPDRDTVGEIVLRLWYFFSKNSNKEASDG